jgi:ATP-dependent Lhr-like helicase
MTHHHDPSLPFEDLVVRWFIERFGRPTEIQSMAWPRIISGEHLLISAPTGSGKTMTAFLWSLNQLIRGSWGAGTVRVLYVSPLKALNNDIRRNLLEPLHELRQAYRRSERQFPDIHVQTRSGDTPQAERRKMLRTPPEILITTPESLNLLISSKGARSLFRGLKSVILDEIHAVFGSKRGVHLISAVERLAVANGEFQRVALSATVRPMEKVAAFVGGYMLGENSSKKEHTPRPVAVVTSKQLKAYAVKVCYPVEILDRKAHDSIWDPLAKVFRRIISNNQATLFFTNSRRLSEKLTFLVNQGQSNPLAYSHHGSLSKELRLEVESRLKRGELKAIFATSSLELGIDIGALDEVVLVQSPPSVSAAVQRIGRAGHRVDAISRGRLFPSHSNDILKGAVLSRAVIEKEIEPIEPIIEPLDVLAQVIVSMAGEGTWDLDLLLAVIRCSYPFHGINPKAFDLVIEMLAGRYAGTRIRALKAKIAVDRIRNSVTARKGALMTLFLNGGTIPDRGHYQLRHADTNVRIGELDEEYVWEARKGQLLTLGTQSWKIRTITHNDVFVIPATTKGAAPPFWRAEENNRDRHLSHLIAEFLEDADQRLHESGFKENICDDFHLDDNGADELLDFLKKQKQHTRVALPHRHHLVVEHLHAGPGGGPGNQVVLHTFWGGRINRPYAMALEAAFETVAGLKIEIHANDDSIALVLPEAIDSAELLDLVRADNVEALLTERIEGSGIFGAMFRQCAGRALLLGRRKFGERVPLWLNRLRAQKLYEAVKPFGDFPIMLEAWRSCLKNVFDIKGLKGLLIELEQSVITWSEAHTKSPSPMARMHTFQQINDYMYRDDSGRASGSATLHEDLLDEMIFTKNIRPAVPEELIQEFEAKRQRTWPGYSPDSTLELIEWVKERIALTSDEWDLLLDRISADHGIDSQALTAAAAPSLVRLKLESSGFAWLIVARELAGKVLHTLYNHKGGMAGATSVTQETVFDTLAIDPSNFVEVSDQNHWTPEDTAAVLGQWLSFYGPLAVEVVEDKLGLLGNHLNQVLSDLKDAKQVVAGQLIQDDAGTKICDANNYEILLRTKRSAALPAFTPLVPENLPLFLAAHQGLTETNAGDYEKLAQRVDQLAFLPLPAKIWETDILPARLKSYDPRWMDSLMMETGLLWMGAGPGKVLFGHESDLDFLPGQQPGSPPENGVKTDGAIPRTKALFPEAVGRYPFKALLERSGLGAEELGRMIWELVWCGEITNDSMGTLRRGIAHRFKFKPPPSGVRPIDRGRWGRRIGRRLAAQDLKRRRAVRPVMGNWYRLNYPPQPEDPIQADELIKDRIRLLLDRYGILFPELVATEAAPFKWSQIFKMLRLMEFSGEVLGGLFFHAIPGPQFTTPKGFKALNAKLPGDAIYWMGATDPASLCGKRTGVDESLLPKRMVGNHLVYHGNRLVVVSHRKGRHLQIHVEVENCNMPKYLFFFEHLLGCEQHQIRRIVIESINHESAATSPYLKPLREMFDVSVEPKIITLYRKTV